MAAVTRFWGALQYAGPEAKNNHAIVMAAVAQCWKAIQYAGPEAKNDREIILAALTQHRNAFCYAGSRLLEDEAFALEVRDRFYLIKVVTLSGTSCVVAVDEDEDLYCWALVIEAAAEQLGLAIDQQSARLLRGTEEVPKAAACSEWQGSPQLGEVCEYQLVITTGHADS
eukprot:2585563-Amphidinium_carterae.1